MTVAHAVGADLGAQLGQVPGAVLDRADRAERMLAGDDGGLGGVLALVR